MIKLSTINQVVEGILGLYDPKHTPTGEILANEAVIYYKTAMICEEKGIDEAMRYYTGTHSMDELEEFRTGVFGKEDK